MPQVAPYGSWKSPITADQIVQQTIALDQVSLDGDDIYWIEMRPAEGGRNVIVCRTAEGEISDRIGPGFDARSRVHEYGGGAFAAVHGTLYFSNFSDQRLYRQFPGREPSPLTTDDTMRYADAAVDGFQRRIICVREDHTEREPVNTIVTLALEESRKESVLVGGNDFYSSPRVSPDGDYLAWLTWNHPNMPWDGSELWVGELNPDGSIGHRIHVAGGPKESIFQPEWSPAGVLHFVSDRTGWWNLYRWRDAHVEPLHEMAGEFGQPQWVFGRSAYAFESAGRIICSYAQGGIDRLAVLEVAEDRFESLDIPFTQISSVRATPGRVVFAGGSPTEAASIVQLDLPSRRIEILRSSSRLQIGAGYLSVPQALEFPTEEGLAAHAFFYPPKNPDYTAPSGERPPLLVKSHGGPTGATSTTLNLSIQYWTSRGIAVLDVNYGGSTGYGRAYRERLKGQWGIVDVDDCVNGARYLIDLGEVDCNRLAIDGRSAGGYTTLCALTFREVFKAGASYYGVSDLEALVRDTHKFESRYLEGLVGPYPEKRDVYQRRSPINFVELISCPIILFQGLEDKVVPASQAELMREALRAKGLPVAYIPFKGEQHGFRRAENIKRSLEAEYYFYSRIFGFTPADPVDPVLIENL